MNTTYCGEKMKIANPFYKSKRWLKKRAKILRRDEYMCQESKRYGKTEEATTIHHCYSFEEYPELAFEDWNLISLCSKQHNAMHDRTTHKMTELGLQWQERIKESFIEFYRGKQTTNPNVIGKLREYKVIS